MEPEIVDPGWQRFVGEARAEFYKRQFGPLPETIHQLINLRDIWTEGGIYQMAAPRLGGLGVCVTSGLTNPDLPARWTITRNEVGEDARTPREPRVVPPGLAGYGYELAVLTPTPDPWPLLTLSWFVQMEILGDVGLLEHLASGNGVVVEGVAIGDGTRLGHFLVQPACSPVLARIPLPNGLMHLLIATWITEDEMEFAKTTDDGRFVLLNRLVEAGVGPVSRLDRPSILKPPTA
jgi:hypothetical protein